MLPVLLRAALPKLPRTKLHAAAELPDLTLDRADVPIDARHVTAYADLCGFPRKDTVPLSYPHLLAFELHLRIMADASFPFPAIGTVHLENSITQHRPIGVTERLTVAARPARLRPHPKGQVFDMLTTARAGDELVWEETSTFLRRGPGPEDASAGTAYPDAPPHGITWRLPADLGRRYASVSGDRNPIHLYPLTARAFGFPRQIAHGMWTMARCVSALENRLPDRVTVSAAFKKPVLLPGSVAFGARAVEDGWAFSLTGPTSGSPHLVGAARQA